MISVSELTARLHTWWLQLVATCVVWVMYHLNHLLYALADLLVSPRLAGLAHRYSNYYNLYLLSQVITYRDEKSSLTVLSQETDGDLVTARLAYTNLRRAKLRERIASRLSIVYRVNPDTIQLVHVGRGHAEVMIPLHFE